MISLILQDDVDNKIAIEETKIKADHWLLQHQDILYTEDYCNELGVAIGES